LTVGPLIGSGSGALAVLDSTASSEIGEGWIEMSEESGVKGRVISVKDAELAGEEEVTGCKTAIFSAE
jgi:hypothetical protein